MAKLKPRAMLTAMRRRRWRRGGIRGRTRWVSGMSRKVVERMRARVRGGWSTDNITEIQCGSSSSQRAWTRNGERSAAVAMERTRR